MRGTKNTPSKRKQKKSNQTSVAESPVCAAHPPAVARHSHERRTRQARVLAQLLPRNGRCIPQTAGCYRIRSLDHEAEQPQRGGCHRFQVQPHSFPLHVVVADGAFVKAVAPAAFGFYCAQPFCRRPATQSHARSQLLEERKLLPVHQASADLREILALHGVVIIVGETGSGKTTQVGQPSHRALCCWLTCPYRCHSCCTKWDSLGWV